ncbi:MAG: hypothetical protein AABP62_04470 [Planctomycetota bacterium]
MKTLVVALCTALFVFALASAWSDTLQPRLDALAQKSAPPSAASATERPTKRIARPVAVPSDGEELPAPTRVAPKTARTTSLLPPEAFSASETREGDAATLREQMAEVKQREARLTARQETLRWICDDIHAELAVVDNMHRQAADALTAAEQRVVTVVQRDPGFGGNGHPESGRPASTAWDSDETPKPSTDSPAIRSAVLLIRRLVSQGSTDTATSLLSRMKQREAAKVLTALSRDDPQMASRLMSSLSVARGQVRPH